MTENILRRFASFVRWRLVPVRYLERLKRLNARTIRPLPKPKGNVALEVERFGLIDGPTVAPEDVQAMRELFLPRLDTARKTARNHPFVNLTRVEDLTADNVLMKYAFSKDVLDVAMDYFGGRATLSGLQILYSFPWDGVTLKESQKWHLDYTDSRSLHWVAYLNDVVSEDDGPFVCLDKQTTNKVGRSMIVRRIEDAQMVRESGGVEPNKVYAKAGGSVLVDPAAVYHYGSRSKTPRLAIFITFNSDIPFNDPTPLVSRNAARIASLIKEMRPDLDSRAVNRMLMI